MSRRSSSRKSRKWILKLYPKEGRVIPVYNSTLGAVVFRVENEDFSKVSSAILYRRTGGISKESMIDTPNKKEFMEKLNELVSLEGEG